MKESQDIRFTKKNPWSCPSYKDYFIKDRPDGKNIYGHDSYSYALFRRKPFITLERFKKRKQAYRYVRSLTGLDQFSVKYENSSIILNNREYLGVIYDGTMYRIAKRTCEVQARPAEDEQITGWAGSLAECLCDAKQIIRREEL